MRRVGGWWVDPPWVARSLSVLRLYSKRMVSRVLPLKIVTQVGKFLAASQNVVFDTAKIS
jgi:hypothetical protein